MLGCSPHLLSNSRLQELTPFSKILLLALLKELRILEAEEGGMEEGREGGREGGGRGRERGREGRGR